MALRSFFSSRLSSQFSSRFAARLRPWLAGTLALTLGLPALPAWAADPFRPNDPHDIGETSEAAFYAMFQEGDYVEADALIQTALQTEPNEPMIQAMAAAMAYLDGDWAELERRAQTTQQTAQALMATDPLRGNLYLAVGIFLEGGYILQTQGIARGTPMALRMLQQVFGYLGEAEKIDRNDPELSLLKGFMDLLLAVNLPFANPDQAIARLRNGYPPYLSHRGIALGLRDLERYDEALVEVEKALNTAAENPDLIYLKAQIYRLKGEDSTSVPLYEQALTYADQMPDSLVEQIRFEHCLAEGFDGGTCTARVRTPSP